MNTMNTKKYLILISVIFIILSYSTSAMGALAPAITGIEPKYGFNDKETEVIIFGLNFTEGATVKIGDISLLSIVYEDDTTLRGKIPAGILRGIYDISVDNSDGQSNTLPSAFMMFAPGDLQVRVDNVTAPPGAQISIPIIISDISVVELDAFNLSVLYDPQFLQPGIPGESGGLLYVDRTRTLTQEYELFTVNANLNGEVMLAGGTLSPTTVGGILFKLLFTVKTTASGVSNLTLLTLNDPGNDLSMFSLINGTLSVTPAVPKISGILPTSGSNDHETTVTINGSNFAQSATAKLGTTLLPPLTFVNSSHLIGIIPQGLDPGIYDLTITNPDSQSDTLPGAFNVIDTTPPTITEFSLSVASSTLTVAITAFTAIDNVGVTGFMVTESTNPPGANTAGWSNVPPASYSFTTEGAKNLYAWAKDYAGNVSASLSASVTIVLPDIKAPTVTAFTIPATSSNLTVSILSLTATDNTGVTGYLIKESSDAPTADTPAWSATPPTSYSFPTEGAKTLYAWARDAAGNVSASLSASVKITLALPDTAAPEIRAFVLPTISDSLTVAILALTAKDNVGVTGYLVKESSATPAADESSWKSTPPTSYSFTTEGVKTLYVWAKDAAGNVSNSKNASVSITLSSDATYPDLSPWVGKWFKIYEKTEGYLINNSRWARDVSLLNAYLKIWSWDPNTGILECDLYGHDSEADADEDDDRHDKKDYSKKDHKDHDGVEATWSSESISLKYLAGSESDFLVHSEVKGDLTAGFAMRIRGWEEHGTLLNALIQTLGGYYFETGIDKNGSKIYRAGGLSIKGGALIHHNKVPVPANIIAR